MNGNKITENLSFQEILKAKLNNYILQFDTYFHEITLEIASKHIYTVCEILKNDADLNFECLIDLAGVDYLEYGETQWVTTKATGTGFDRAVDYSKQLHEKYWKKPRFGVTYHLLSYQHNTRLRLKTYLESDVLIQPSVTGIWPSANWYEREAFDLYGILFENHPDLRRILTDYGFIGYPFRKDFPLSGNVEVRYDATLKRVIYEPVDIVPRLLVPKVIRGNEKEKNNG